MLFIIVRIIITITLCIISGKGRAGIRCISIAMMCADDDGVKLFRRNGKSLWLSSAKD